MKTTSMENKFMSGNFTTTMKIGFVSAPFAHFQGTVWNYDYTVQELSNIRHILTGEKRITLTPVERCNHTSGLDCGFLRKFRNNKEIYQRCYKPSQNAESGCSDNTMVSSVETS